MQKMITIRERYSQLLFLLFTVMVAGCSKISDGSQLVGVYQARHPDGVETIELRADGTYTYRFNGSTKTATEEYSATWKLEPYGGESKVSLDNFKPRFPNAPNPGPIATLLGVEKKWGQMRLYLSYDRDQYYTRKPNE
jgi:hypothetical protein